MQSRVESTCMSTRHVYANARCTADQTIDMESRSKDLYSESLEPFPLGAASSRRASSGWVPSSCQSTVYIQFMKHLRF